MGKSVDEGCRGVAHTKYIFFLQPLRAEAHGLFFFPLQGAISAHLQSYHWKELSLEVLRDLKKFYLKPLILQKGRRMLQRAKGCTTESEWLDLVETQC